MEFSLPDELETTVILVMGCPKDGVKPNPLHYAKKPLSDTVKFL